ncbi:MAG: DUF401 family protein [Nitrospira sp.]|nr:DUF401 family protein [Nitrospira sp.]
MYDIIKISISFILIVLLIRRKVNLGIAMTIGAVCLAVSYLLPFSATGKVFISTLTSYTTIQLVSALGLIMIMENIMRKTDTFKQMMEGLKNIVQNTRIVLAAPPAIIGMVPSIGGAYFSAPLVEEASSSFVITPERKGFINYWFRHIWEYILPTYPGIILASAITHIPLDTLILYQLPFAVMVIITGSIFCFKGLDFGKKGHTPTRHSRDLRDLKMLGISLLPIALIIFAVALLHIDIALTMAVVVSLLFLYHRYPLKRIAETLKESISWSILFIMVGVIFFKEMLGTTGAVKGMSVYLAGTGFPLILLFFILPFMVGFLTGLTIAFVGTTFPLLISMSGGLPGTGNIAFAFASGFAGVMFSPVHLCFVLTGEYFSADKGTIYRYMLIPSGLIMLTAIVMWVI